MGAWLTKHPRMAANLTMEQIQQLPLYEARTEGVWYVDDNADFAAAWVEFSFDGLHEIGLDVEGTQTYDEQGKRQRTAALVQMTSDRGTLLYHSWLTSGEFLTFWEWTSVRNDSKTTTGACLRK